MAAISRREFFKKTTVDATVAAIMASGVGRLRANPLGLPIGSQTYPHRMRIRCGDFAGLLKDMKGIGIEVLELCDPINYADFKPLADGKAAKKILDDNGMKAISAHVGMRVYRENYADVIKWAHAADVVLAFLLVFFGMKFAKGKKFMPSGMMCILTVVALALRHI